MISTRRELHLAEHDVSAAVELFAALAHPVRLRVLLEIQKLGEATVGDLVESLGVEQSSLSHQLAALRKARLVIAVVDGRRRIYKLTDQHVAHIVHDAVIHSNEKPEDS